MTQSQLYAASAIRDDDYDTPHLLAGFDDNEHAYEPQYDGDGYDPQQTHETTIPPSSSSITSAATTYYSPMKESSPYYSGYISRETMDLHDTRVLSALNSGSMDLSSSSSAISSVSSHTIPADQDGVTPSNLLPSMPSDNSCNSNEQKSVSSNRKMGRKKKMNLRKRSKNANGVEGNLLPPLPLQKPFMTSPGIPGLKMLDATEDSPGNDTLEDVEMSDQTGMGRIKPRLRPRMSHAPSVSSIGSNPSILRNGSSVGSVSSKESPPRPSRIQIQEIYQPKIQAKDDSPLSLYSHVPRTPSPTFSVGHGINIPKVNRRRRGFPIDESPKLSTLVEGRQTKLKAKLVKPVPTFPSQINDTSYPHRRAVSFPDEVLRRDKINRGLIKGNSSMESEDPALFSLIETTHSTNGRIPITPDVDTNIYSPHLRIRAVHQVNNHPNQPSLSSPNPKMHRRVKSDTAFLRKNQGKRKMRRPRNRRTETSFDSGDVSSLSTTGNRHQPLNRRNPSFVAGNDLRANDDLIKNTHNVSPSRLVKLVEDEHDHTERRKNFSKRQSPTNDSVQHHALPPRCLGKNARQTSTQSESTQLHNNTKRTKKKLGSKLIPKWIRRSPSRLNLFRKASNK